jgi:hypothetical protein
MLLATRSNSHLRSGLTKICENLNARGFETIVIKYGAPERRDPDDVSTRIHDLAGFLPRCDWPEFIYFLIQNHSVGLIWIVDVPDFRDLLVELRQAYPWIAIVESFSESAAPLPHSYLVDHFVAEDENAKAWLIQQNEADERISVIPSAANEVQCSRESCELHANLLEQLARRVDVLRWPKIVRRSGSGSGRRSRSKIMSAIASVLLISSPARLIGNLKNAVLLWRLRRSKGHRKELSEYFDPVFYLSFNPDVASSGLAPLLHYAFYGFTEGRDPSPRFSTSDYLAKHADVARAGINPLLHYLIFGRRDPSGEDQ